VNISLRPPPMPIVIDNGIKNSILEILVIKKKITKKRIRDRINPNNETYSNN
jgi:hypothetical protein